jgi:hypothetical protein
MDNRQELDTTDEKNFFLTQVKKNPRFLWQHLHALTSVILDQYKAKYLTRLRGKHLSTKKPLPWLKEVKGANRSNCQTLTDVLKRIPQRKLTDIPFRESPQSTLFIQTQHPDLEDYLAKHRWGILLDNMLSQAAPALPQDILRAMEFNFSKQDPALETYSVCERVANVLLWSASLTDAQRLHLPECLLTFLQQSLQWILKHLEFYGKKTGNHILNNARVLLMAGTVLNNRAAVETGWLILKNMLPVLIQKNGFLRERSSHYQLLVFGWLLDARAFMLGSDFYPRMNIDFLEHTIINMRYATGLLCDAEGYLLTLIGDVSPDFSPFKTSQRLARCYPETWPLDAPQVKTTLLRDDWGFLQTGQDKIILNCPAGDYPKTFSSHAHNDITGFVWLHDNKEILIDCGRARYTKDPVSSRQKSALGHSVAFVNGFAPLSESLVINGNWWPTPYASATVACELSAENTIAITHDGFKRATPVNEQVRKITLLNSQLQVNDLFRGQGDVLLELRWQLNPGFQVFNSETSCVINGDHQLEIDLSAMRNKPQLDFIPADAKRSRYSCEYGHAVGNPFILMRWQVKLPFTSHIVFRVKSCVG